MTPIACKAKSVLCSVSLVNVKVQVVECHLMTEENL